MDEDDRYISEEEAKPDRDNFDTGLYNTQTFKCPKCGSYNTFQTTYVDGCNSCEWSVGY